MQYGADRAGVAPVMIVLITISGCGGLYDAGPRGCDLCGVLMAERHR